MVGHPVILIGVGANLPSAKYGPPLAACREALAALQEAGIRVVARSHWYESAPLPTSDQPWYVNGVVRVETNRSPSELLGQLHRIEAEFGRVRGAPNAPRVLDLDLLAYGEVIADGAEDGLVLPHPRLHERAFVLLPLSELAPDCCHPVYTSSVRELMAALPSDQVAHPLKGVDSGQPV